MSVTYEAPVQLAPNLWRVSWSSDLGAPPATGYRVFRNGVQIGGTVYVESMDFTLDAGESLVVEVLDDPDASPSSAFPSRLTLGWRPVSGAASYRVDEYVASVWTARRVLLEDGSPYYRYETRVLEDVTSHQFRVVPVDEAGNDGTALSFTVLMVRYPDAPWPDAEAASHFAYDDGTNEVTVSA